MEIGIVIALVAGLAVVFGVSLIKPPSKND